MIDTVVLSIPWGKYELLQPDLFAPSARPLIESVGNTERGSRACTSYIQNSTRADISANGYRPRLTIRRRFTRGVYLTPLRIEFSIPKLLFGNNLAEISETAFNATVDKLHFQLFKMGIKVKKEVLENCSVIAVHFCKNITLNGGFTALYAIRQLSKLNFSKKLDHNTRDFRNDGQALYLHCGTHQVVFYDKMADLRQSDKRSLDYRQNDYQLNLLEDAPKEVLRWEIRLTHKNKVLSVFNKLDHNLKEVPFNFIFNDTLASKVMRYYWSLLYSPLANVLFREDHPDEILQRLFPVSKNVQSALEDTTLVTVAQKSGVRGLRSLIESHSSCRTWYRVKERLDKALLALNTLPKHDIISAIERSIGLV